MSIVSANSLEAKGFRAVLSNKLTFYKGDRLNLSFIIANKLISEVDSKEVVDGILPIDSENVEAFMILEDGSVKGTIKQDNKVVFMLEPEYQKIGENYFQIVIKENLSDGSIEILHTPPFKIDIEPPLGYVDGDEARVGYALVGKSRVAAPVAATMSIDYDYTMTVWETGDLITADRLNNIEMALDSLLYKAITVSSMNLSRTSAELGESIASLMLTWAFSKPITYQKLDGVELELDVRSQEILGPITSNKSFKMECSDGRSVATRTAGITFMNGSYRGSRAEGTYNSNFILSLNKVLTNSKGTTFSVTCSPSNYVYYAIPTRFGTPIFNVGGFDGGFAKVASINFTNVFGYTEPYDIYRSDNPGLGSITVNVR